MLQGKQLMLRLIREADLDLLSEYLDRTENRGSFYPATIRSLPSLQSAWREDGFWTPSEGHLAIADINDVMVGEIQYFTPHPVTKSKEIAYVVYDLRARNHGLASEAVSLFVPFLFRTMPIHRIELTVGKENTASIKVAERNGFTAEGTARDLWYSPALGMYINAVRYSILRREWADRQKSTEEESDAGAD